MRSFLRSEEKNPKKKPRRNERSPAGAFISSGKASGKASGSKNVSFWGGKKRLCMAAHFVRRKKCEENAAYFRRKPAERLCMGSLSQAYTVMEATKDIIYFRNDLPQTQARYQNIRNQPKAATISAATGNQQFNYMSRSKTPTADIMYYPNAGGNNFNTSVSSSALNKRAQLANFENIYQPFNMNANQLNENEDFLDSVNYSLSQCNQQLVQQLVSNQINSITSDVDGNYYVEMVVDLYRQESGFGFRIVGGEEEGSQVAVGYL
jgi:hypothetical protein